MSAKDLSILIPARNEMFLYRTIEDVLANIEADTEIIAVLDGSWTDPSIPQNDRINLIYVPESIGQRAATNLACKLSKAKYVMKIDAHCAFDKGFDRKMIEAFKISGDNVTMVPIMRNLWAFDWKCFHCGWKKYQGPTPKKCEQCGKSDKLRRKMLWIGKESPKSKSYCFDAEPHFQYFNDYTKRPEYKKDLEEKSLTETMSLQGSCWMLKRDKYWELDICDERFGSWGSQGIEVACKTWLSGGRVLVNHKTWYAHMFRTQGGDFSFPYPISSKDQDKARHFAKDLFFRNSWDKQIHPLSWLLEKFWPVKGWTEEDLRNLKINKFEFKGNGETVKLEEIEPTPVPSGTGPTEEQSEEALESKPTPVPSLGDEHTSLGDEHTSDTGPVENLSETILPTAGTVYFNERKENPAISTIASTVTVKRGKKERLIKNITIIGHGWVGKSVQKLFPDAYIYDAPQKIGSKEKANQGEIAFICVPTPSIDEGRLDTSIVEECMTWCECPLIVIRSTVNPGTCDYLSKKYNKRILMQPEYLGETPEHPLLNEKSIPFLIIGGDPEDRRELINLYTKVYNANVKIRQVTTLEAEVIKLSENRAIAFKVAQCQELYDACEKAGIDYYTIRDAVYGDDPRFNLWWTFVFPDNRGMNSKCLPKDVYAWCAWAESLGIKPEITRSILETNKRWVSQKP